MKFFTFYDYERRASNRRLQKSVPLRIITLTLISVFLYIRLHIYVIIHSCPIHPSIHPPHARMQATIHPASHLEAQDVM
jgi:hypothetical protein